MASSVRVEEVLPGVFARLAVDNAGWIVFDDFVVAIDALEDAGLAEALFADIARTTDKPVRYLVNTHGHGDHTACNRAFRAGGAIVVGHEQMRASAPPGGESEITFSDRMTIQRGPRRAEMHFFGGVHSPGDTVIVLPAEKVAFSGDLFGWGMLPLVSTKPETPSAVQGMCERLLALGAETYITGHGPLARPEHIRRWLTYLDDLYERVPHLRKSGKSLREIEAALPAPEDVRDWHGFDWKHPRNIELIFAGLR